MGDSEDRVPGPTSGAIVVSTVGPDGAWVEAVHPQSDFEQSEHGAIFGRLVDPVATGRADQLVAPAARSRGRSAALRGPGRDRGRVDRG